ncbi:hypothetical protein SH139x_005404 [Planctomycetaceae bacterium SH139]
MPKPYMLRAIAYGGLLVLLLGEFGSLSAEPPTLTRIFPAGGQRGQTVEVSVKGKLGEGSVDFWTSRPWLDWQATEAADKFLVAIKADATPGVGYVRAVNNQGASDLLPFVIGHLPEQNELEPNDELTAANAIQSSPVIINGVLQAAGDVDHFLVKVEQGQTLVASLAAETDLASPVDASLRIVSPAGHFLAQNLDHRGLDPQLVWTAPETGDVLVQVFGFPAAPNSTIALAGGDNFLYRLTLTTGPFLEGVLPLAISAEQPTALQLLGWNIPAEISEVRLQPSDAESSVARNSVAFFQPGVAGLHQLPVVDIPLVVRQLSPTTESPGSMSIELPALIAGNLSAENQRDIYEFDATKGAVWEFKVESRQLGYPLDAVLEIVDIASGKQLLRVDDTARQPDPAGKWTVPADGRYRVILADVNGLANTYALYRLTISPPLVDFRLQTTADRYVGKVGEALEIAVKTERLGGYAETIDFVIEDPPAGLTMEAVTSAPGGETAKEVKLRLTASGPLNQPVRILGRSQSAPDATRPVRNGPMQIDQLWITIQ